MVELPQQQPLMRSKPSNSGKVMVIEPRVAQIRHVANVAHLTCPENAQHGGRNFTSVEIKIILVHVVGQNKRASWTARNISVAGAHQEVAKVRADGLDPEVDPQPAVPIA